MYCGSELYHIPTYIPVELQIKYEHSNRNLECLNKLSALIAAAPVAISSFQHTDVALPSVLTTRYSIPILLCNITFVAQEFPLNLPRKVLHMNIPS